MIKKLTLLWHTNDSLTVYPINIINSMSTFAESLFFLKHSTSFACRSAWLITQNNHRLMSLKRSLFLENYTIKNTLRKINYKFAVRWVSFIPFHSDNEKLHTYLLTPPQDHHFSLQIDVGLLNVTFIALLSFPLH